MLQQWILQHSAIRRAAAVAALGTATADIMTLRLTTAGGLLRLAAVETRATTVDISSLRRRQVLQQRVLHSCSCTAPAGVATVETRASGYIEFAVAAGAVTAGITTLGLQ